MTPSGLEGLKIPERVRRDLEAFLTQLCGLYAEDLVSLTIFGSAVTGGYEEATSDVNLLVVYSDLNIADLTAVAKLAQSWLKKRRFVPRFLSERNLSASARYFQIDWMEMRETRLVVCGRDVLAGIEVLPADMRWQLAHEVKRMRMRVKQQFWRVSGDAALLQQILTRRFSSLMHLTRALFFLENRDVPPTPAGIVEAAVRELGIDGAFAQRMLDLRAGKSKPAAGELAAEFAKLMDAIRAVDERIDRLAV